MGLCNYILGKLVRTELEIITTTRFFRYNVAVNTMPEVK